MSESNLWSEYRDVMLTAKKTLARPSIDTTMRARLESLLREGDQVFDLDQTPDLYGKGVVASLERRFADLLGKPAAVFFPTGTMAQQVVLRAWAERSGRTKVALHALSHPEVFESNAFPRVSGLETVPIASGPHLIEASDIAVLPPTSVLSCSSYRCAMRATCCPTGATSWPRHGLHESAGSSCTSTERGCSTALRSWDTPRPRSQPSPTASTSPATRRSTACRAPSSRARRT